MVIDRPVDTGEWVHSGRGTVVDDVTLEDEMGWGMRYDLKTDVFCPVVERVRARADSLRAIRRCGRIGIESWFKVEAVAALDPTVQRVAGGPDLELRDGQKIELKAATDIIPLGQHILDEGVRKYNCPCLFLGDGTDKSWVGRAQQESVEVVGNELISVDGFDWVVGLIKPLT